MVNIHGTYTHTHSCRVPARLPQPQLSHKLHATHASLTSLSLSAHTEWWNVLVKRNDLEWLKHKWDHEQGVLNRVM